VTVDRVLPVLVSIAIIVLVAVVQQSSRELAAIVAVMPLTVPLAVWIVFTGTGRDYAETAHFVRAMVPAYLATIVFVVALWYGLRQQWPFPVVIAVAFVAWGALVAVPSVVRRVLP
jgi:hypothetical protein